jgi:hypothetical protein
MLIIAARMDSCVERAFLVSIPGTSNGGMSGVNVQVAMLVASWPRGPTECSRKHLHSFLCYTIVGRKQNMKYIVIKNNLTNLPIKL